MKERQEETKEKYPCIGLSNERKYLTDREILKKYRLRRNIMFNGQIEEGSNGHDI